MRKTTPTQNGAEPALTTPSQLMEDASITPSVRAAVKFRSRCHRPSGKLDVMCSHCLSSPIRSACESRVRFILLVLAFSNVDSTANMSTTLPDKSLCSNSYISPHRVQGTGLQPTGVKGCAQYGLQHI